MKLLLLHPAVARRSCADCQAWMHDDRGGNFGPPLLRAGKPIARAPGAKTPCAFCPKIPPGADPRPENAVELTERGRRCWDHYKECAGVGWQVPDAADPLVRYHAGLFKQVEDAAAKADEADRIALAVLSSLPRT